MSRYIDAQYLFKCETCRHCIGEYKCDTFCDSGECYSPNMAKIPTADVVEVRHGEWVEDVRKGDQTVRIPFATPGYGAYCSLCGEYAPEDQLGDSMPSDFCPNCGAKMDGERREG